MDEKDWEQLKAAYDFVAHSGNNTSKIESTKWTIYKVGTSVIRIDIKVQS